MTVPDVSHAQVKQKTLSSAFKIEVADGTFDVSGTEGRTKFQIGDNIKIAGFGAKIKEGTVIKQYMVEGDKIKIQPLKRDGKTLNNFVIPVDAIQAQTMFDEGKTQVVATNPESTRIIGGVIDISSGSLEANCDSINSVRKALHIGHNLACGKLAVLSNWKETGQAKLETGLRKATLDYVQDQCTQTGWDIDEQAAADGVIKEAIHEGYKPQQSIVSFVDDDGQLTNAAPQPKQTDWQKQYGGDTSKFSDTLPGTPTITFDNPICTYQPVNYTPQYPDQLNQG